MLKSIWPILAAALAGCAGESVSDISVAVPPHIPASGPGALSGVPSRTVQVNPFTARWATGAPPGKIGAREAVGDVTMGQVVVTPTPEVLLATAIEAELEAAGHRVTRPSADVEIGGEVAEFAFRTDVTALYWDVVTDATLVLDVRTPRRMAERTYSAHCTERTYAWPSRAVIAGVVGACVSDIADGFRDDRAVAGLLEN